MPERPKSCTNTEDCPFWDAVYGCTVNDPRYGLYDLVPYVEDVACADFNHVLYDNTELLRQEAEAQHGHQKTKNDSGYLM